MSASRRAGSDSEDLAADHLITKGFTIVTRRFKAKRGELDLVALDGEQLVFVEVKQRKEGYVPEEAIGRVKIERLYSAAREYLSFMGESERAFRFDVVAIGADGLRHHRNVFLDLVNVQELERPEEDWQGD
jgi:putative endonuclease